MGFRKWNKDRTQSPDLNASNKVSILKYSLGLSREEETRDDAK
jgi:hypothetical protein